MERRETFSSPAPAAQRTCIRARDGAHLFHRDWGDGRPVLFVASWAFSSEMWAYQAAQLSEAGYRCIAYDRRGHGRSDMTGGAYDMDLLADDLAAVIEGLGLTEVSLVGHSMGCAEIIRYAARHGTARIRRIAMLAPAAPFLTLTSDNPFGVPAEAFAAARAQWASDFPGWIEANKDPFVTPETSPAMLGWLAETMRATPAPVAIAANRTLVETDLRPDLTAIDRPTLVVHGTKDASIPLEIGGARVAAGVAGAELQVLEGAPHGLFVTHMEAVNRALEAFLSA
jgi:pimeloyl-ACP methyl ester carboxylesterase